MVITDLLIFIGVFFAGLYIGYDFRKFIEKERRNGREKITKEEIIKRLHQIDTPNAGLKVKKGIENFESDDPMLTEIYHAGMMDGRRSVAQEMLMRLGEPNKAYYGKH